MKKGDHERQPELSTLSENIYKQLLKLAIKVFHDAKFANDLHIFENGRPEICCTLIR